MGTSTTHYNLDKPAGSDNVLVSDFNTNMDILDAAVYDASQTGGISIGPNEPEDDLAWIDTDENGADFCYVGPTAPTNDGSVAIWVDTSDNAENVNVIEVSDTQPAATSAAEIWVDTSDNEDLEDLFVDYAEDTTISTLNTTDKTVVGAINELKSLNIKEIRFGRKYFPQGNTGTQTLNVTFSTAMSHAPNYVFLTWSDTDITLDRMQGLVATNYATTGFTAYSKRTVATSNWWFCYCAVYVG